MSDAEELEVAKLFELQIERICDGVIAFPTARFAGARMSKKSGHESEETCKTRSFATATVLTMPTAAAFSAVCNPYAEIRRAAWAACEVIDAEAILAASGADAGTAMSANVSS